MISLRWHFSRDRDALKGFVKPVDYVLHINSVFESSWLAYYLAGRRGALLE